MSTPSVRSCSPVPEERCISYPPRTQSSDVAGCGDRLGRVSFVITKVWRGLGLTIDGYLNLVERVLGPARWPNVGQLACLGHDPAVPLLIVAGPGSGKTTVLVLRALRHVLVDRISLAPPAAWAPFVHYRPVHRGDVIVFFKPNSETPDMFLVKRAIGIPGDRVHLRNGVVFLNGVQQNEPFAGKPQNDSNPMHAYNPYRDDFPSSSPGPMDDVTALWSDELPSHIQNGDLVVPPGKIFAMGDNRTESLDGRYWGFVPQENIVGRPMFVYWSFKTPADQINKQSIPDRLAFMVHIVTHLFTETRWSRTFHLIR